VLYRVKDGRIAWMQQKEGKLTRLATSCGRIYF
jgi:hypothetical protein